MNCKGFVNKRALLNEITNTALAWRRDWVELQRELKSRLFTNSAPSEYRFRT